MKAAVYLRQSSDPNNDQLGIGRQRQDCIKLCETKGWPWAEYRDNDTSASSRKPRKAYQEMLTDIRNGAISAVVVWDLDRLHRLPRELETFIDLADEKHLSLATVTGDVNLATDNGRLIARIKGAVARAETERKVARMTRRYQQDRENGQPYGPARAFGYTRDHKLDKAAAAAVRQAYRDILAGQSLYGIAKDWNAAGFTSARGKAWTQTGVRAVLLNPRNTGYVSLAGEFIRDDKGKEIKAKWPAIIDRDIYDTVRAILTDPERTITRTTGRKYLMSGLAICGKCGKTLGSAMPSKRGQQPRYHCKHCRGVARKIETVDDYVLRIVAERLSRKDAADLLERKDRPDLPALRAKANALRADQDAMALAHSRGDVTLSQLITFNKSVDNQLADISALQLDATKARVFDGVIAPDTADVRSRLEALPLDRQRAVIDTLLTLTVLPGQARGKLRTDLLPVKWKG